MKKGKSLYSPLVTQRTNLKQNLRKMKIFHIFFLLTFLVGIGNCVFPLARLFNLKNHNPDTATFIVNARNEDRSGQDCFSEGQKADSVCVNGTWLFYNDDFMDTSSSSVPTMITDDCTNLPAALSKKVSSYRAANDPEDVTSQILTLYAGTNYRGEQQKIIVPRGGIIRNVEIDFRSFIASSDESLWEFCQREDGQGLCICIYTNQGRAIPNIEFYLNLAATDVKSVRRDCSRACVAGKYVKEEL